MDDTMKLEVGKRIYRFECTENKEHMWIAQKWMHYCPECGAPMICVNE